jgi:K+-transporting ATPase KdpF subunit
LRKARAGFRRVPMVLVAAVLAILLFVYLLIAMLHAERFS